MPHVPHRLGEVIVLPAAMDAWGHHIACRRAASISCPAPSHHADELVVLSNRNGAYEGLFVLQLDTFSVEPLADNSDDSLGLVRRIVAS